MYAVRANVLAVCLFMLGGCVAGQHLDMEYAAESDLVIGNNATAYVFVKDNRPYVLSGEKPASYVGKYRAGFGNPWDVTTEGNLPLADIIARDLREDLDAMGFVVSDTEPSRTLQVSIVDWSMDSYQNGRLWCELDLTVLDGDGAELIRDKFSLTKEITGTLWEGGKGGVEREMPVFYKEVIIGIARANDTVLGALTATP